MPWIDVTDAKLHLNKAANVTVDDAELEGFIAAACSAIEERMGHVDLETFVDVVTVGSRGVALLDQQPVSEVNDVRTLDGAGGGQELAAADPVTGVAGWELLSAGGVLAAPASCQQLQVTYRAGRDPVPGSFRLAALELVAHLWRASQLNPGASRDRMSRFGDNNQVIVPGIANALPYRVRELLGLDGKMLSSSVLLA